MKKVTFAILGMGNRGTRYALMQLKYPEEMEVTAIADNRPIRMESANKFLNLPQERLFDSAEAILAQDKLADMMIIATQDAQHKEHAIAALRKGYDLLLEKPISNDLEACREVARVANELGRTVIVCHVLRYTGFYQEIKKLINEGVIGDVVNLHASEMVGYYHIAHSFVRGNWHKESDSSPLILAKCCHDMDLLLWLSGKSWKAVSSYGELTHFNGKNCPEGATERCSDGCPVTDCVYNAPKFYLKRMPGWPTNTIHPEPTEEIVMELMRTTDYGRCVYKMDNDVVDHQSLAILMEDGVTASFTVSGFNHEQDRSIHVMGTKGNIWGNFRAKEVHVAVYGQEPYVIDVSHLWDNTGHGGGDGRMMYDVIRYMRGDDFDTSSITSINRSVESHELAFAAEASRVAGGERVCADTFNK